MYNIPLNIINQSCSYMRTGNQRNKFTRQGRSTHRFHVHSSFAFFSPFANLIYTYTIYAKSHMCTLKRRFRRRIHEFPIKITTFQINDNPYQPERSYGQTNMTDLLPLSRGVRHQTSDPSTPHYSLLVMSKSFSRSQHRQSNIHLALNRFFVLIAVAAC